MPRHAEQRHSPYSPGQLFRLVSDVERYPEFLPWCRAARILEREENGFTAELVISFKHLTESYVSRVTLTPPESEHTSCAISVDMISGPFEHLSNRWHFQPFGTGTEIDFEVDFKFRSRLLESLIGGLFEKAAARMGEAFNTRADALYGEVRSSPPYAAPSSAPPHSPPTDHR